MDFGGLAQIAHVRNLEVFEKNDILPQVSVTTHVEQVEWKRCLRGNPVRIMQLLQAIRVLVWNNPPPPKMEGYISAGSDF